MNKHSESLFLQGNFKKIVTSFERKSKKEIDLFVVGAYVFIGQTEDAEVYFNKWTPRLSADEVMLGSFFLAIGWTRSSHFEFARKYLFLAYAQRFSLFEKKNLVFLYQAFGFYRHFCCRYNNSYHWARKAWKISLEEDFSLGQILSSDLLAHALFQKGEIEKGFAQLEKVKRLALQFGRGGLAVSVEVSKVCYEAQFGKDSDLIVKRLLSLYKKMNLSADSYSKANLGLELSRQFQLRGQIAQARQILRNIQTEVFKFGHRRQKSLWFFRLADCEWKTGNTEQTLSNLEQALASIDPAHDLAHHLQILGFQEKICKVLDLPLLKGDQKMRQKKIRDLTFRIGSFTAQRYLSRTQDFYDYKKTYSLDQVGNLIDQIQKSDSTLETNQALIDKGLFGLIEFPVKKGILPTHSITMGVLPGSLLLLDQGNIYFQRDGLTSLLQRTILLLKTGPKTKLELIEGLWGYQYDSLRHDPLVYALIVRLRKLFGPYSSWIQFDEVAYSLKQNINVSVFEHNDLKPIADEELQPKLHSELNYRQIRILIELKTQSELSIRQCMDLFKSTKITTNRDIKQLLNLRLISKSGRGKSTRYSRKPNLVF